jgi:hypothetical protein
VRGGQEAVTPGAGRRRWPPRHRPGPPPGRAGRGSRRRQCPGVSHSRCSLAEDMELNFDPHRGVHPQAPAGGATRNGLSWRYPCRLHSPGETALPRYSRPCHRARAFRGCRRGIRHRTPQAALAAGSPRHAPNCGHASGLRWLFLGQTSVLLPELYAADLRVCVPRRGCGPPLSAMRPRAPRFGGREAHGHRRSRPRTARVGTAMPTFVTGALVVAALISVGAIRSRRRRRSGQGSPASGSLCGP